MTIEILIGTHNVHKVKELSQLLPDIPLKIRSLLDFPKIVAIEEDGKTLEENARKKAESYAEATGLFSIADDTGLEVQALNGEPGVRSARYAGEQCSYADNNRKLLKDLSRLKNGNRSATFRCVIACCNPANGKVKIAEGSISGRMIDLPRGKNGFGYDPIFYLPKLRKTLAELSLEEKNRVSHRAVAMKKAGKILKEYAKNTGL